MSRLLILVTILGMVTGGLQVDSLPSYQSWVSERFSDVVGTASEGPLANATETDLTTERDNLDKELCEARKSRSAQIVDTKMKAEAHEEGGKAVGTVQKPEKLPVNKTVEAVAEETEKLPSNATVKKTVERQVVKGTVTGNETIIEKESRTDTSTSNMTVTKTVQEHKVVVDEEGEFEETEVGKKAAVTEKAEQIEKEVETSQEPEPEDLPVNFKVKETSVKRKVVTDTSEAGEPQKEVVIEKTTQTDTTEATEIPEVGKVNASVLDEKAGPTIVVVTENKTEKFAGNETKEVVVEEKVEKLPSNDTVKKTVVERKVTKDTGEDSDRPQQETITEKEIAVQVTNKSAEAVKAAGKDKKQVYKEKIQNIKQQVEEVREKIKEEEIKADKLDGVPESCEEISTKEPAEEKKVEKVIPVKKVVETVPAAEPGKVKKELVAPVVKEAEVVKVVEKETPVPEKRLPPVVVTEKKAPKKVVPVTGVPEEKKVVPSLVAVDAATIVKAVKGREVVEKRIPVSEGKTSLLQTVVPAH